MSKRSKPGKNIRKFGANRAEAKPGKLRIVGGKFRGRSIDYSGDSRTRPMKDNIREATFNLIGGWIPGKHVFDTFAGTGAIGLEALSRGAQSATFIERHIPTAKILKQNLSSLQIANEAVVETSDTFFWSRQFFSSKENFPREPWAVFISPPYDFYIDRVSDMVSLVNEFVKHSPDESIVVVESDSRFDPELLPDFELWRVRDYSPARLCILR